MGLGFTRKRLVSLFSLVVLYLAVNAVARAAKATAAPVVAGPNELCGFVEFVNRRAPVLSNGGFYQPIRIVMHLGDGGTLMYDLDYPFYYPNEAAFPWSDRNIRTRNFPVDFQFPPAEKRAGEPAAIQFVMSHSTPGGITSLKKCPG